MNEKRFCYCEEATSGPYFTIREKDNGIASVRKRGYLTSPNEQTFRVKIILKDPSTVQKHR